MFPAKPEKFKTREIRLPRKSPATRFQFSRCGNCERFCFSFNLSGFVSRLQQSRIREAYDFFSGKKVRRCQPRSQFLLPWERGCPSAYDYRRGTWGFAVLRCWRFFNAVMRWIKSQLAVLRWSQTTRCAMFVFFTLRWSVKWNCLRCWSFFIYLSRT